MVGNGFGWGQLSHVLAWVLHVAGLEPLDVTATTHTSDRCAPSLGPRTLALPGDARGAVAGRAPT